MAFFEVEHFIEEARHVQSQREIGIKSFAGVDLLARQPSGRTEGELHLISIEVGACRSDCGPHDDVLESSVVDEGIMNALRLCLELCGIVDVLPFASPAGAEIKAPGFRAEFARLEYFFERGFCIALLRLSDPRSNAVAGYGTCHENDVTVPAGQRFPAVGEFLDLELYFLSSLQFHGIGD